jgi:hypothetical protein
MLVITILVLLLTLSAIYDLDISNILAKPFLHDNQYYSSNGFANTIEIIG